MKRVFMHELPVWITRSQPGADELAAVLLGLHGRRGSGSVVEPVVNIVTDERWRVSPGMPDGTAQVIVLTSHAAATSYFKSEIWSKVQTDLSCGEGPRHVAVGASTAWSFQQVAELPIDYPQQENSSGVLELLSGMTAPTNVWIIAGYDGRTLIADSLRLAGHQVTVFPMYRRQVAAGLKTMPQQVSAVEISSVTAAEGVAAHWADSTGRDHPCVVPSERVGTRLLELGFHNVHNAHAAGVETMADCLAEISSGLAAPGK